MGLWCGPKLATECFGSGIFWKGQGQPLPVPCLESRGLSYRVICRWCHLCWAWRRLGEAKP